MLNELDIELKDYTGNWTEKADNKMKILITVPDLRKQGGVTALFKMLNLNAHENVRYFNIHGNLPKLKVFRVIELIYLFTKFSFIVAFKDIVHINPSLDRKSFLRDGVFTFLAKLMNKRVMVYWHGWQLEFEEKIYQERRLYLFFRKTFLKADMHVVLGNIFREKLENLGVDKNRVRIETNSADDRFINRNKLDKKLEKESVVTLLFLSRVEIEKGIFIAIDAVRILREKRKELNIILQIAGEGSALAQVKEYIKQNEIKGIELSGYVAKEEKHLALSKADILILPSYTEGMPVTIIEGMLYGLPVISRPVGGIPDWVYEGENGYLLLSKDPEDFAETISQLIDDPVTYQIISDNNQRKARKLFTPEAVTKRLFSYYGMMKSGVYPNK